MGNAPTRPPPCPRRTQQEAHGRLVVPVDEPVHLLGRTARNLVVGIQGRVGLPIGLNVVKPLVLMIISCEGGV